MKIQKNGNNIIVNELVVVTETSGMSEEFMIGGVATQKTLKNQKNEKKTSPKFEICCSFRFFGLQPQPPPPPPMILIITISGNFCYGE